MAVSSTANQSHTESTEPATPRTRPRPNILVRVFNRLFGPLKRRLRNRNHVFRFDRTTPLITTPPGTTSARFDSPNLPADVLNDLAAHLSPAARDVSVWELERGAVMFVVYVDGAFAGTRMSRRGKFFKRWILPLEPDDIVLFRGHVVERFRGRRLSVLLDHLIIASELEPHASAYLDCKVYNTASIRSHTRAGFKRITTKRPLRRGEALGEHPQAERD